MSTHLQREQIALTVVKEALRAGKTEDEALVIATEAVGAAMKAADATTASGEVGEKVRKTISNAVKKVLNNELGEENNNNNKSTKNIKKTTMSNNKSTKKNNTRKNKKVNEYYRYNESGFVMPLKDPANTAAREANKARANQKPLSQEGGRKRKTKRSLTRKILRVPQGAINTSLSVANTARKGTVRIVKNTGKGAVTITRSAIKTGVNVSKNAVGTLGQIATKTVRGLTNLLKNSINVAASATSGTLKRVTRKTRRNKH